MPFISIGKNAYYLSLFSQAPLGVRCNSNGTSRWQAEHPVECYYPNEPVCIKLHYIATRTIDTVTDSIVRNMFIFFYYRYTVIVVVLLDSGLKGTACALQ
jgi:hypothetical protein